MSNIYNYKRHFHIDSGTSTEKIFASSDTAQSDNEDEIDELMNDSDLELITCEEIELTRSPVNASVQTSKANVHVADEGTTHTKELETNTKRKKPGENAPITQKCNVSPHYQKKCILEVGVYYQCDESASALDANEKRINLDVLIELHI